ncbi:SseB family protein [Nocardioides sp.]|uniref:SseB family protein n=1 Tax=Nocardioides sp. TaxID=35761 RepID=UPI00321BB426
MNEPPSQRRLLGPAVPDDDGRADPALVQALTAYGASSAATDSAGTDSAGAYVAALARLQHARLLVPVVAVLGEVEVDPRTGLASDKSSDMAAVLLQTPDGRRGLLAFTSTDSLAAWDAEARPVPVTARQAAEAAVQEQASALVVDVAGPTRLVVDGDSLTALGAGYRLARIDGGLAWVDPSPTGDG